ncbi:Glyoxalase/Bleomycin resistance protein/dioxygenase domain [Streptococcus sp. DD11]|uniref:VOC family protein n=1 Tax=Streptococcus sp. DD11 TaxID=1777879 RepID=UPI000796E571|nr:VOC family protein [Streptococcus sp. DD11]KXT85461.1 Glyoxalase/Bleomycin resistance protein/dioxygenase domain [Streptococcus sp. DD11]
MITSLYPVLMCENLEATANFFIENFQFRETFRSDWYISLIDEKGSSELAFILSNHDTIPAMYQNLAKGLIVNLEVDNVDLLYQQMLEKQIPMVLPIRSEDFGQRHFIIEAPGSVLVDVIQVIPPSAEFVANYLESEDE